MTIEDLGERFERTELYLKQRLGDYKSMMPVKGGNAVTLLEIYGEWMDFLVKENLKKKSDLLKKWQTFLLERNTDAIADLLIGFFEAKRRYGRDKERGEDERDWFTLCKNYCKKNGWNNDENLLHSFFSSYSGAERRIYRKVEEGKVLADTSKSLFEIIGLTKEEMAQKEEEKRRKAEERLRKKEETQRRKEERLRIAEEKRLIKSQKKNKKENVENNYNDENLSEDDDKEVDPDYPKAPDGWRDPVNAATIEPESLRHYGKRGSKKDNDGQYSIDFGE